MNFYFNQIFDSKKNPSFLLIILSGKQARYAHRGSALSRSCWYDSDRARRSQLIVNSTKRAGWKARVVTLSAAILFLHDTRACADARRSLTRACARSAGPTLGSTLPLAHADRHTILHPFYVSYKLYLVKISYPVAGGEFTLHSERETVGKSAREFSACFSQ